MTTVTSPTVFPPSPRAVNFVIAGGCTGMILFALYLQEKLSLHPCPLCITQRICVIAIGVIALVAALHNPARTGVRFYAVLQSFVAIIGMIVSGNHVRIQHLPEDQVPACGPGLQYLFENFPLQQAVKLLFRGDGNCHIVDWTLLGLSIPEMVFICCTGLLLLNLWQLFRAPRRT
jgi:disulfide bond formation protein DsbB